MFGRSRSASFQLYGKRRSRWRLPGWFLWWLFGGLAGAAGLFYVQERYLPPRLSNAESTALRAAFADADAERQTLRNAETERARLAQALDAGRTIETQLRATVDSLVEALPPDPRGGPIAVRAADFAAKGGKLDYTIVLSRERAAGKMMAAVLQLTVSGESTRGAATSAALEPVPMSIGGHAVLHGSLPLPDGMRPRQATVEVLDRKGGKALGMRVLYVP